MGMAKKEKGVLDAFKEKYKKLPVRNRIGLIKTARNLSGQQKDDTKEIDDASIPQDEDGKRGLE